MVPSRVRFTILESLVAHSKDKSTTTTIPSGSVVEVVHPAIGDMIEVQWEDEHYSVSLSNLLRACRDDVRDRWGSA